jgi:hypothetical protein
VRVDHRRADVVVAEQLLDRPDVGSALKKMSCEAVPKRMAARGLCDACR